MKMYGKKLLSLLLALALICACLPQMAAPARAAEPSGQCGTFLTWEFDETSGQLSIRGDDEMWDWADENPPWYSHAKDIKKLYIEIMIDTIGAGAFRDCVNLTSTNISDTLVSIGDYAFDQCAGLSSITIPDSVTYIGKSAFRGCTGLTRIVLPQMRTVKREPVVIGEQAFADCTSLSGMKVPRNVASIGTDAFRGCSGLNRVEILNKDCKIGEGKNTLGDPAKTVIRGFQGSTAETYAKKNGYSFEAFSATSGKCGDSLNWTIDMDNGELTVSGTGKMTDWPNPAAVPWVDFKTEIEIISIGSGVTNIGDYAFCDCSYMYSVEIPDTVTEIGNYAFAECTRIYHFDIPYSVTAYGDYAFANCDNLYSPIYVSGSVSSIGKNAFSDTRGHNIGSIYIMNKDCEIYDFAGTLGEPVKTTVRGFAGSTAETYALMNGFKFEELPATSGQCGDDLTWSFDVTTGEFRITGSGEMWNWETFYSPLGRYAPLITTITIQEGVTSIGNCAFMSYDYYVLKSVTIPASVTSIGAYAFYGCSKLTDVKLPDGLKSIGNDAFPGCSFTSIAIPASVTEIGDEAFYSCGKLTNMAVPEGVKSIGDKAFRNCQSLTSVSIPASVASIGSGAFAECPALTEIKIDSKNPSYVFEDGVLFTKDKTVLLACLQSKKGDYQVPSGVEVIDKLAFYGCTGLTSVTVPDGVTSIGGAAFLGCTGLESVTLPDSITEMGSETFERCESLKSVTIPKGVTVIGVDTFSMCSSLTTVVIPNGVKTIGTDAFHICTSLKNVTIPSSVTSIYGSAFYECTSLTSVTLPYGIEKLSGSAFGRCINLEKITVLSYSCKYEDYKSTLGVPGTTTVYGRKNSTTNTFADTYGYTFVELPESSGQCGDKLTWDYYWDSGRLEIRGTGDMWDWPEGGAPWYLYAGAVSKITLPTGLTSIGDHAFSECVCVPNVTIPAGVTSIGDGAFSGCFSLTRVTVPNVVKSIGEGAFSGCSSLTSVTVPVKDCVIGDDKGSLGDPDVTTVRGYGGSTADKYAKKYGYKFEDLDPCAAGHDFVEGVCSRCGAVDPTYVPPGDRTKLDAAITAAEALKEVDYTPETYSKVRKALADAKALPAGAGQADVDAAEKALTDAMDALEMADPFRFDDVKNEKAFYFTPVYWAYNAKPQITNGLDLIYFGPNKSCTRGQVVTFLWRAAGCPKPANTETAFTDVAPKAFYAKAVAWAVEKGITNGMSPTSFAPDATCTRGQIVTFLWRFKGTPEPTSTETGFTDVNSKAFYAKAVAWAVENKVTNGMTPTTFAPDDTCTRGQIVTFLYRAVNGE